MTEPNPPQLRPVDDLVLWIVIAFCLVTPLVLASIWTFSSRWYPPMLLAVLLGIAVAALTYRYLGGTGGSSFSVGVLKVAGSAALLLGTAWLTNDKLSGQMDTENAHNELVTSIAARQQLQQQLDGLRAQLDVAQHKNAADVISAVKAVPPGTDVAAALNAMARVQEGPFSRLLGTVTLRTTFIDLPPGTFNGCADENLAGKSLTFARLKGGDAEGQISSVTSKQSGLIEAAVCRSQPRKFDLQMSCQDGLTLFPDQIASCTRSGQVGWRVAGASRIFSVGADVQTN